MLAWIRTASTEAEAAWFVCVYVRVCACMCMFGFPVFSHSHLLKQQLKESGGWPCVTDVYQLFLEINAPQLE